MTNPLISFIIPVYKTEQYLKKCLESLLDQDYPNIEIICVMDGKSKKAEKIIDGNPLAASLGGKKRWGTVPKGAHRILDHITIPHSGAPGARNEGETIANGDYLCFWDSDCYADPGMVTKWMTAFEQNPDVAFVYEGYRFNDNRGSALSAYPFDPYLLTVNNYIATCFPMKREVFPGFDESLQSLQDWDFWLTIVENGHRGRYLGGFSFTTEMPTEASISGIGCTRENWLDRMDAVKKKHNIPDRPVCFTTVFHERALDMAKCAEADFRLSPGFKPNRYKVVIAVGFHLLHATRGADAHVEMFAGLNPDCKKVLYWTGSDAEELTHLPYRDVPRASTILNQLVAEHWCETHHVQRGLADIGINAEIVPMPLYGLDDPKIEALPKTPRVLLQADVEYGALAESLAKAMPDIVVKPVEHGGVIADHSVLVRLSTVDTLDWNCSRFLANGRRVISNIRQPHYGYVDVNGDADTTKKKLLEKIRSNVKYKRPFYVGARYYRELLHPEGFQRRIKKLCQ